MLEEQHAMAGLGENVCPGEPAQTAANHDHIILVGDTFEPVVSHESSDCEGSRRASAMRIVRAGKQDRGASALFANARVSDGTMPTVTTRFHAPPPLFRA